VQSSILQRPHLSLAPSPPQNPHHPSIPQHNKTTSSSSSPRSHPSFLPLTLSSPKTLALPMNSAPTYPPKNRMSCACTAVMRIRFSVSAMWAFNCASCACRWAYCRFLLALVLVVTYVAEEEALAAVVAGCRGGKGWVEEGREVML